MANYNPDLGQGGLGADSAGAVHELRQAGSLYEQAGASQGAAVGGLVKEGLTLATDARLGQLEAQQSEAITQAVTDARQQAAAIPANAQAANAAIAAKGDNPPGQFKSQTDALYEAYQQGVINKNTLDLRIADITRQFSAKMPGWAQDFRRNAAETMGVSGVDHAGIQAKNEQLKADWEFSLKQDQDIMLKNGLNVRGEITPAMRQTWKEAMAAKDLLDRSKVAHEQGALTQQDADKSGEQQIALTYATHLTKASEIYNQFAVANPGMDMASKEAADKFRLRYNTFLSESETITKQEILKLQQGPNAISADAARKMLEESHNIFTQQKKMANDEAGMSMFLQGIANAEGQSKLIKANMENSTYALQFLGDGAKAKLVEAYITLGRDKFLEGHKFGIAGDQLDQGMQHPEQFLNGVAKVRSGQVTLDQQAALDPKGAQTTWLMANDDIQRLGPSTNWSDPATAKNFQASAGVWVQKANVTDATAQLPHTKINITKYELALPHYTKVEAEKLATPLYAAMDRDQRLILPQVEKVLHANSVDFKINPESGKIVVPPNSNSTVLTAVDQYNTTVDGMRVAGKYMEGAATPAELASNTATQMNDMAQTRAAGLRTAAAKGQAEAEAKLKEQLQNPNEFSQGEAFSNTARVAPVQIASDQATAHAQRAAAQAGQFTATTPAGIERSMPANKARQAQQAEQAGQTTAGTRASTVSPATETPAPKSYGTAPAPTSPDKQMHQLQPVSVQPMIVNAVKEYPNVPVDLVHRVIAAESKGDVYATSAAGARGLMQLMPKTAAAHGLDAESITNPEDNVKAGVAELSQNLKWAHGNVQKALAAYNWGINNLESEGWRNLPTETKNYIKKIVPGPYFWEK